MSSENTVTQQLNNTSNDEIKALPSDEFKDAKSLSEEDTSISDGDPDIARREAEKRERLGNKRSNYESEASKSKRNSKDVIIESITKELPKDLAGLQIWINIIAGVLSLVFLTVVWAQYLTDEESEYIKKTQKTLITIAMTSSMSGQLISWYGTTKRSKILWTAISIALLAIEVISSLFVIIYYFINLSFGFELNLLFQMVVLSLILCLTIATIILNIMAIRRMTTLNRFTETLSQSQH